MVKLHCAQFTYYIEHVSWKLTIWLLVVYIAYLVTYHKQVQIVTEKDYTFLSPILRKKKMKKSKPAKFSFVGRAMSLTTKSTSGNLIWRSGSKVMSVLVKAGENNLGRCHRLCFIAALCLTWLSKVIMQRDKRTKSTVQTHSTVLILNNYGGNEWWINSDKKIF